jgi:hypothetical protein
VLPRVPYRQWVASFPKRVRYFAHHDKDRASSMLGIVLRAIEAEVRAGCPGAPKHARVGAVAWLHRFGSSLNAHTHVHVAVTDGVYAIDGNAAVTFYDAIDLEADVAAQTVARKIRFRILRHLVRHDCIEHDDAEQMLSYEHQGGFSVDASVHIADWDRSGLERLCRYCSRHPFAKGRLQVRDEQTLVYRFAKPDVSGRTELSLTPFELFDRLVEFIAPPRRHRHRYYGALAPNCPLRPFVTLTAGSSADGQRTDVADPQLMQIVPPQEDPPSARRCSSFWAMMIAKVYEVLPLLCKNCHAEMKLVSFITDDDVVDMLLTHLGEPTQRPTFAPARDPPQSDFDFDQADTDVGEAVPF